MTSCGFAGSDTLVGSFRTPTINIQDQFQNIFHEVMHIDPTDYNVVLIKNAGTPQNILQQEARLLFTVFGIKACTFFTAQHGVIFTWVNKGASGLVIDMGYDATVVAQICDLATETGYTKIFSFAGKLLQQYIIQLLIGAGISREIIESHRDQFFPYLLQEYFYFESKSEGDFEYEAINHRKNTLSNTLLVKENNGDVHSLNLPDPILSPTLLSSSNTNGGLSYITEIANHIMHVIDSLGFEKFGSDIKVYDNYYWVARILLTGKASNVLGLRSLLIRELVNSTALSRETSITRSPSNPIIDLTLRGKIFSIRNTPLEIPPGSWLGASIAYSLANSFGFYITKEVFQQDPAVVWSLEHDFLTF
jgi:actin-related protein